ncbi:MAG: UpxY family transcription antiterminator [Nitrospirota bacterium]
MINWYAVHVKNRHEFKVYERLLSKNIESFLPVFERLCRWKDRKKLQSFPLFNGYLFTHITGSPDEIMLVLKTQGVVRILGTSSRKPEPIPETQIVSLKKLVESKEQLDPYPYLKEGQWIRIRKGALAGAEGILIEKAQTHIFVVSIDIFQRGLSLKIDASDIDPVALTR